MSRRRLLSLLGWIIGFGSLAFFWNQFFNPKAGQPSLSEAFASLDWRYVVIGMVMFSIGHGLYLLLPLISHRVLRQPLTVSQAYRYWCMSQLAKYLPGGIWLIPARTTFYFKNGMPLLLAGTVVFWEVMALLVGNLIYGLLLPGAGNVEALKIVPAASLILIMMLIVSQMLWPWKVLQRFGIKSAGKTYDAFVRLGSRRYWLLILIAVSSFFTWWFMGTGFYCVLLAFDSAMPVSWWSAVAIYGVAWAVGFLVVLTPAGLGAREATVVLLLTPTLGPTLAFSAALVSRIAWTFGETIHIAAAFVLQMRGKRDAAIVTIPPSQS